MAIESVQAPIVAASTPRAQSAVPPATRPPAPQAQAARMTAEQVEQVVKEVRQVVEPVAQHLQFSIDADTERTVVKVVDGATQEVIRQIPSEELLAISRALDRLQGLLLHKKA